MKTQGGQESRTKYILNGSKCFISNGPIADVLTVFAIDRPFQRGKGIRRLFIVEKEYKGYSVASGNPRWGEKAPHRGVAFRRPGSAAGKTLIGQEGRDLSMPWLTLGYLPPGGIASQAVGSPGGAGCGRQSIPRSGAVRQSPSDISRGWLDAGGYGDPVEAARAITYQAADLVSKNDAQKSYMSACCKMFASMWPMRLTTAPADRAGYGYMTEYPFERMMRDAKINADFSLRSERTRS